MGTCQNRLAEAVLTSTHNLCCGAKIRKIGIPLQTPVLLYKSRAEGVYIEWTCFPDVMGDSSGQLKFFVGFRFCINIKIEKYMC